MPQRLIVPLQLALLLLCYLASEDQHSRGNEGNDICDARIYRFCNDKSIGKSNERLD